MSRLVALSELREADQARFGGKAVHLGQMLAWALPVPPGFAVCFDSGESERLGAREREQIRHAYAELAPSAATPPAVAVRSSAVGEDGGEFSFAGLHSSRLNVVGQDAVLDAVAECLASQQSERTASYREAADLPLGGTAVIVQLMVPADFAGVCFTRSPTREDELVVELVSGLAEGLAAGTRRPTRVDLGRENLEVRSRDDPDRLLEGFQLDGVREVARLALSAEKRFGYPLDVEWATRAGRCQLVQARPITGGTRLALLEQIRREEIERLERRAGDRVRLWSDFSLADMLPRPTPLGLEIIRRTTRLDGALPRAMRRTGLRGARDPERRPLYERICGRVYLSLDPRVIDEDLPLAVDARRLPAGSQLTLDPSLLPLRPVWPGWRGALRLPAVLGRLVRALFRVRGLRRTLARELEARVRPEAVEEAARLRKQDLSALSNRQLWEAFRSYVERIDDLVYYHQLTDNVSVVLHQLLRLRLRWLYGPEAQAAEMRLTTGLPGNLNTETNLDLARVASGELDRETFVERYGHRGNPDWQISSPRWREDASRVDAMVAAIAQAGRDPVERFEAQQRVRAEAEARLSHDVRRRWWLRPWHGSIMRELRDYQRYSPQRETTQGLCYLFVELARNAALEAAHRSALGDLIFFFSAAELERWLVQGPSPDVLQSVRERRRRLRAARTLFVPHVVRSDALDAIGRPPPLDPDARTLAGQVVSSGAARGRARVVQSLEEAQDLEAGEILVAAGADPAWTPLFLIAGGAVLEQGGLLSHPAIVAREYGLPAVVNVAHATRILRTGQMLTVDADRGLVALEEEATAD